MDDLGSVLLVFLLGDPLGFEGGEGREGGTTSPDGVVSVLGGDDLDHVLLWAEGIDFLLESVGETLVEGGTTGHDDVGVEILSDIDITLLDGLVTHGVHTEDFVTLLDEAWLEEGLWTAESSGVDGDHLSVWELVLLLALRGLGSLGLLGIEVEGDVAELLLDLTNDLLPGGLSGGGLVDVLGVEEVNHMLGDGSTGNEVLLDGMWDGETLEDWDGVGNSITGVDDHTGGSTVGVEGEDSLDGNVKSLNLESLEHELGHLLSVGLWVVWSFSEHDLVLGWVNSKLVREAVVPDLLHQVPLVDDTRLDWVLEVEDTSHLLGLITNVLRLGLNTNHLFIGSWDTDDGWELN